jgi:GNAT superfamily N-acetyltransferase
MVQSSTDRAVEVRSRSFGDVAACVGVLAQVHQHDGYPTRWPANPAAWLSPPDLLEAWVAELDGVVCGHVALVAGVDDEQLIEFTGRGSNELAAVSRLFVSPTVQGSGLGAALLRTVMRFARERDMGLVLDVVDSERSPAIALYEYLGWQLAGRRPAGWITAEGVRPQLRLYACTRDAT